MPRLFWTDAYKAFVIDNACRLKDAEIAATLSRVSGHHLTVKAVARLRSRLGLKKRRGRGKCEVLGVPSPD